MRAKRPSSGAKLIGALVGNKSDYRTEVGADSRAEIDFNQATRQAKELGFEYFETSAVPLRVLLCIYCIYCMKDSPSTGLV